MMGKWYLATACAGLQAMTTCMSTLADDAKQTGQTPKKLSLSEAYEAKEPTPALPYPAVVDLKPCPEPDPLVFFDSTPVKTREDWEKRKQEILDLSHHYIWGFPPPEKLLDGTPNPEVTREEDVFDGTAIKRTVRIHLAPDTDDLQNSMWLYVFIPKTAKAPLPAVLSFGVLSERNEALTRYILGRGYVTASFHPVSGHGMHRYYFAEHSGPWVDHTDPRFVNRTREGNPTSRKQFGKRPLHAWGERCIWEWRMRRVMDGLVEQTDIVDRRRVILMGGSRGGQSVVLAAALDPRAAMVFCWQGMVRIRKYIWTDRPEWHCLACMPFAYNHQMDCLPIDMHCLAATLAPRPFVMTYDLGRNKDWSAGVMHAYPYLNKVYRFLGKEVQPRDPENWQHKPTPVDAGPLGVFMRPGGHKWLQADLKYMLDFADEHLKEKQ